MKINFTKKQYRSLIDLIYLGDFMVNGIRTTDRVKEYDELREYIYSFAKQMGQDDIIEHDKERNKYFETREFETGKVESYMEDYDNEVFWTELSARLAERDLDRLEKITGKASDPDLRLKKYWSKEDEYNREFEQNGLNNVEVSLRSNSEKD